MRFATCATLILTSSYISIISAAYLPNPLHHRLGFHHSASRISWVVRARDGLIRSIWPAAPAGETRPASRQAGSPSRLSTRYGEDLVLRFSINTEHEANALAEAVQVLFLDVWDSTPNWVDIRLSKTVLPSFLGLLPPSLQNSHTPLMHDLAQVISDSYPSRDSDEPARPPYNKAPTSFNPSLRTTNEPNNVFFRHYQPLTVIIPWMRLLRSLFPTHVRLLKIGLSYEGRDIHALRVGVHPTNDEQPASPRKTILVTGGIHAREWISTSTVTYIAYSFITAYGRSKQVTKLLEQFDFVFIPTLNPDGYVHTWETDRLWRKNRQPTPLHFCQGLDLDRSFAYQWDGDSEKASPCSESYSGDTAFEAVESARLAEWARNETMHNNVEFAAFLDFHSYSQQVLYPYAFSCTSAPPTLENLEELAIGLAKAIRTATGETYGVTSACEGGSPVECDQNNDQHRLQKSKSRRDTNTRIESGGGSALDWFHHELKVPYAYQIKLRDTGTYGFLLPSENIVPTGKEAFKAVEHVANFLAGDKGVEPLTEQEDVRRPKPADSVGDSGEL